ncbi:PAS domain S-box protein [Psychroflexus sp. YR1-1]|uniref:histidine kinase n=1 Tax=Psychroflexus aurantiacus TaxID=2709310 RepID=A0A6B3R6I1_9FLAO|nr:PAS domain S-box protein [Psychroflexus aurantiacus]NEV94765.1 PAS domain S-box protein [Psychroflexus aurantiacus]
MIKNTLHSCIKSNPVFLDLINDYATEGYLFWNKNNPEHLLIDSKLGSRITIKGYKNSVEINPYKSDTVYREFLQQIISKVLEKSESVDSPTGIENVFLNENSYNTKLYFSTHKESKAGPEYYLVAIKSSGILDKRNPLETNSSGFSVATWQYNVQTGELHVNDNWANLLGYTLEELGPLDFTTFANLSHPEDISIVKKLLEQYVVNELDEYRCEIRMKHKNGNWVWILAKGNSVSRTDDGRVEWMIGSHIDISERKEKEQESEAFALVAKETDYSVIVTSVEGITTFVNDSFTKMTGYSSEEMIGHKPGDILHGELTKKEDIDSFRRLLQKKEPFNQEILNYRKNGEAYDVSCFVNRVLNDKGEVIKFISLQRDITEEKRNKNFLRTFKNTLDQTKDCVFLFWETNLEFFYVNEAAIAMMGYSEQELLSLHPYDIKPEYPKEKFRELSNSLVHQEEKSVRFKTTHKTKSGEEIPVEIFIQYINNKTEEPYFLAIVHDISERLESERKLNQLSLVAENTTDFVIIMDSIGKIEYINEAFEQKTGYSLEEIEGKKSEEFLHGPETDSDFIKRKQKSFENLEPLAYEVLNYTKAGDKFWVSATLNPVFDKNGEVQNIIAIGKDITDRKELELSLKKEKKFLDEVINSKTLSIVIIDSAGNITFANDGAENILGLEKSHIEKKQYNDPVWNQITLEGDPFPEEELPFVQVLKLKRPVTDLQHGLVYEDGTQKFISVSGAPFEYQDDQISKIIFNITDITERVQAQKQLNKTKNQMQSILRETSDVVYSISIPDNKLIYITPSVEKITGYPQAYYYSEDFNKDKWTDVVHEDDLTIYKEGLEELKRNGEFEVEFRVKDRKNNYKWVLSKGNIITKEDTAIRFDGYVTDITNRKKQEDSIQEYVGIVEEQNERLKNFTYIVSHNLRSHSSNIHGLIDLINLKDPELKKNAYFEMLGKASEKLEDTLHHLNEVVSVVSSKHDMKTVKLNDFITDFQSSFQSMIDKASVSFINEIEEEAYIEVVPAFLDSIITNLITNAIKYKDPDKDSYVRIFSKKNKKNIILGVEDNGLGLDLKKYGSKLYGMNKTFHNNKDSRGIGLFLTRNQIESMGGKIKVSSIPKKGSVFKVYFKNGDIQ